MAYDLYPAVDENYDFPPEVRQALAVSMELRNTVVPMTTTVRNNLTAGEKWDGRVIVNTTTDHLERYDATGVVWVPLLNLTGDTMTGTLKHNVSTVRTIANAAGVARWEEIYYTDAVGDLYIQAKTDAGAIKGNALVLRRSDLSVEVALNPTQPFGIATKQYVDQGAVPTGSISAFAGASAPTGWLLAQGQAVSRTTYAALYAVCSTTYGVGDGSTTFNLPNLKGRLPVGLDTGQTEFNGIGKTGGAKTHTLTIAEMPSHQHIGTQYRYDVNPGGSATVTGINGNAAAWGTEFSGGGAAHNNLQPYISLNFIIKT